MSLTRSEVPYPTHGPDGDGGESWHEYFVRLAAERESLELEEPTREPEVVVSGREATSEELSSCRSLSSYMKLATGAGWSCIAGYSQSFLEGVPFKSGEREGELREDVVREQLWLDGHKSGRGVVHIIFVRRNKDKWVCDLRVRNRILKNLSDKEMKEWIVSDVPTEH